MRVLDGAAQASRGGHRRALPVPGFDALAVRMHEIVHAMQSVGDLLQHVVGFLVLMVAEVGVAAELAAVACPWLWSMSFRCTTHYCSIIPNLLRWPSALCLSGSKQPWDLSGTAPAHSARSPCSHAAAPSSPPACGGRCLPHRMVPWHPPYCRSSETELSRVCTIVAMH